MPSCGGWTGGVREESGGGTRCRATSSGDGVTKTTSDSNVTIAADPDVTAVTPDVSVTADPDAIAATAPDATTADPGTAAAACSCSFCVSWDRNGSLC
jgi:hypothetical protein